MPSSSSLLAYAHWLEDHVLLQQEKRMLKQHRDNFTFAELRAGMGSGSMAAHAMSAAGIGQGECVLATEACAWKRKALNRKSRTSACLAKCLKALELPCYDALLTGIVCVDISNLSTCPKSLTDATGKSGQSFFAAFALQRRPLAIVLERVARLDNKRKVDSYEGKGTDQAARTLQERGYVGRL